MRAGKFAVVSFDTLKPELEILKAGYVSTLVGQRPYQMGVDSVLALYNYVTKKIKPKDPTDTGLDIVTPSNVDEFLKKAGG
jgi:ribose transport system substrate-binding protein